MRSCKFKNMLFLLFLLPIVWMGCKKVTIKTVLSSDASLQRTISVEGDSLGAENTVYPFPQDGSWNMMSHKEDSSDSYIYIVQKDFRNVNELNEELSYREDTVQVNSLVRLNKKFRWFYSFYRYEETFFKFFPFTGANMSDYVSNDEYKLYASGNDSTDIEDRLDDYAAHAMFEEFYQAFVRAVEKSALGFSEERLDQKKEELFSAVTEWDFGEDTDFAGFFLKNCDVVYQPSASFQAIKSDLANENQKYQEYFTFLSDIIGEGYQVIVQVPGRVMDTNANNSIKDHEVAWEFEAENFHFADYVMWVESRQLNILPTVITGLFVLSGLIVMWLSARRAYRHKLEEKGVAWQDRKRFVLKWWMSVVLIVAGLALAAWFAWLYIVFNYSQPIFQILDIFNASPQDNILFVSMIALGIVLTGLGCYHLVLYLTIKKRDRRRI